MSSAVEQQPVEPPSPAEARARAASAIDKLAAHSRGVGARLVKGQKSSTAALRSGLARSGDGLRKTGAAVMAGTRGATKAGADFTATRLMPWIAGTGRAAGLRTQQAYAATHGFTAERLIPWIARTARRTRDRLRPSVLHEDFRGILLFLHERLADRDVESVLFVPTREHIPFKQHRVVNLRRLTGEAGRATPAWAFDWAMAAIREPLTRFTFVEFGAGRGRTLLLACGHAFEKVIGIEADARLHGDCQMNIAQYPRSRMKCRDVECVLDDVLTAPLPEHETVFYLFKPVDGRTLGELMARIVASYRHNPRRIYFVCVGVTSRRPIEECEILQKVHLGHGLRLKAALLSPYPIAVYRSIA